MRFKTGERKLKFFASYTQTLCEFECLGNFTLKTCGCVKFAQPRTSDTKVCNMKDSGCLEKVSTSWTDYDANDNSAYSLCTCLSPCVDIKYEVVSEKTSDFIRDGGLK